jgi:hypothetical protein
LVTLHFTESIDKIKMLLKQKIERKDLFCYIKHLFQYTNIYITPLTTFRGRRGTNCVVRNSLKLKMCILIEPTPIGGRR